MKMKQMPYRVEEGAIEQAKYRAKMAVREAVHPTENHSRRVQWRWASAVAMAVVIAVSVTVFVKLQQEADKPVATTMDRLISQMQSAPDEIVSDLAVDVCYYLEDSSTF